MSVSQRACDVLHILDEGQFLLLSAINRKLSALQRLAGLLEELGDFNSFLPDITRLVPILQINDDLYEELRTACPFLNLPPSGLGDLQADVAEAYNRLRAYLNAHPWNRMGNLQDRLNKLLDQFQLGNFPGSDFLQCATTMACGTVPGLANGATKAAKNVYNTTVGAGGNAGRVLSDTQQAKWQQVQDTKTWFDENGTLALIS